LGAATMPDVPLTFSSSMALQDVKVLIVDDNSTNRRILHTTLAGWGMHPTSVCDAEEALAELATAEKSTRPYALILTDMHMPRMDGFALVERIKQETKHATATIAMLTSGGRHGDVTRCDELGIGAYLVKPVRQAQLYEAITRLMHPRPVQAPASVLTSRSLQDNRDYGRCLNILLAEDNPVNQKVAIRLLEKRGHRVVLAATGDEAMAALAHQPFDLVLMDVHMPDTDGIQATIQIREQEKITGLHQPIVAMTALAMEGDRERCLAAGMDSYISKPIDLQQLDHLLETYAQQGASTGALPEKSKGDEFSMETSPPE
jgi:CheY-like chemotaxis protein